MSIQIVSRGHTRPLTEISFVEDGDADGSFTEKTLLVSSAHDKLPQIRSGETGDWIGSFEGHKGAVWSCKVDKKTRTLCATASGDFTAKMWCATTGKELCEFKHRHVVKTVEFSDSSLQIATGCQDGLVRVYDTCEPGKAPLEMRVNNQESQDPASGSAPVKLFWAGEQEPHILVVGKRDGRVEKWDVRAPAAAVAGVSLSKETIQDLEKGKGANDGCLLVATNDRVLNMRLADLSTVRTYEMPKGMSFKEEGGASMHPSGQRFIAGGSDLWLREFDATSGDVLRTFKGHHGPIRCVRYHPSGLKGASGSEDATIRIWDLAQE